MADPSLKDIQKRMVSDLAKKSKSRDNQWLSPGSYDKKMYDTVSQEIGLDDDKINATSDNFKAQDLVKKNTRAPLREEDLSVIEEELNSLSVEDIDSILENDESLSFFIEQTLGKAIKRGAGYGGAAGATVGGIGGYGAGRFAGGAVGSTAGEAERGANLGGVAGAAVGAGVGGAIGAAAGGAAGAAAHGVRKLASKIRTRKLNENNEVQPVSDYGFQKVNELYEEEALDLIEEIMDILEEDNDIDSYCWRAVVPSLKSARDSLVRSLVSESATLTEEHFKAGSLKLKDKTLVKISKKDAGALNAALSGTDNKNKMLESATKSKKDFREFLDFARSLDEDFSSAIDELLSEASIEDLEYIAENELSEGESWDIIRHSTKMGANVGKNVGKVVGTAGGAMYGAAGGTVLALTKAAIKRQKGKKNINRYFSEDENNEKKSVLSTAAPAMDSDPDEDKELQEAKKAEGYQEWPNQKKKKFYQNPKDKDGKTETQKWAEKRRAERDDSKKRDLQEVNQRAFSRITGLKPIRYTPGHQFADSHGGDSSNYKDPTKISYDKSRIKDLSNAGFNYDTKFYKTASKDEKIALEKKWGARSAYFKEDVEELQEISARTLKNYTDEAIRDQMAVDFTGSTDPKLGKNMKTFHSDAAKNKHFAKRERGIEAAGRALDRKEATNKLYKKMGLTKLIKEESNTFIVKKFDYKSNNFVDRGEFNTVDEAKAFAKKLLGKNHGNQVKIVDARGNVIRK